MATGFGNLEPSLGCRNSSRPESGGLSLLPGIWAGSRGSWKGASLGLVEGKPLPGTAAGRSGSRGHAHIRMTEGGSGSCPCSGGQRGAGERGWEVCTPCPDLQLASLQDPQGGNWGNKYPLISSSSCLCLPLAQSHRTPKAAGPYRRAPGGKGCWTDTREQQQPSEQTLCPQRPASSAGKGPLVPPHPRSHGDGRPLASSCADLMRERKGTLSRCL